MISTQRWVLFIDIDAARRDSMTIQELTMSSQELDEYWQAFTKSLREAFETADEYLLPKRPPDRSRFPHDCPRCGRPAYVGLSDVDCSAGCE